MEKDGAATTAVPERCSKSSALIVVKKPKYRSSPQKEDLCTAGIATRSEEEETAK
jgi:hypothetical protein